MAREVMQRVLISDIFGLTDELIELGNTLWGNCLIIDPYSGEKNKFTDEGLAYRYFTDHVGLERYSSHLLEQLDTINGQTSLVGFSVGASAIWKVSDKLSSASIDRAYLFYGSQIRKMLDTQPTFELNLVLPKFEDHFSVADMAEALKSIDYVSLEHSEGLHGFMNKLSRNFNQSEYDDYSARLCKHGI